VVVVVIVVVVMVVVVVAVVVMVVVVVVGAVAVQSLCKVTFSVFGQERFRCGSGRQRREPTDPVTLASLSLSVYPNPYMVYC
jgi:hypothetical protein